MPRPEHSGLALSEKCNSFLGGTRTETATNNGNNKTLPTDYGAMENPHFQARRVQKAPAKYNHQASRVSCGLRIFFGIAKIGREQ
jgi:hypothetical protein